MKYQGIIERLPEAIFNEANFRKKFCDSDKLSP